ncbi:MAG: inverse autotransporter beta domain-containing protein [Candidatus Omnitrophica bacterium]|nr:inverse autotransporter beta domain-containing protein [Candidatus Omnitrophota bacterium]
MGRKRSVCLTGWVLIACLAWAVPLSAATLPDYMEKWEVGWTIHEDQAPSYFIDPILPLYRHPTDDRVVFVEPRLRFANREYLVNLGGGYRQFVMNRSWLLGGNMFYDYDTTNSHYRIGWGLEALSAYAELRANSYLGISQRRLVEERGGISIFEKALNGFDLEAGVPVPFYSRVKVFGGFNWYNAYRQFKNRYGWTLRTEYKPLPFLVIDGLVSDDTKTNVDWGMTVAVKIPLGSNAIEKTRSPLALDPQMFPESDVTDKLWSLVERHHEIVVQKYSTTSGGVNVEIRRGT